MISFTMDMLGWTPNKEKPNMGQTGHPREHLPSQRLGMLDKLSHSAPNLDKPSQGAIQNTLDKRDCKPQKPQTSRDPLRRIPGDKQNS